MITTAPASRPVLAPMSSCPGRKLIFVKRAAPAQMLKTLIHELAHHLDPELRSAPQPERETVAEATAFVVAAYQGIDTGSYSFPYITTSAGELDGATLIKAVMARVQAIAHRLITYILEDDETCPKSPRSGEIHGWQPACDPVWHQRIVEQRG